MNLLKNGNEIMNLISLPDEILFKSADTLRQKAFANKVELCSIINIRNGNCQMDCKFCAQSAHNQKIQNTYPLLEPDILLNKILELYKNPINHIGLVASGSALSSIEFDKLIEILQTLPKGIKNKICLSLGHLTDQQFVRLCQLGIARYHHNLETSAAYYPKICSTQKWEQRARTIQRAQNAGLPICSGGLFGMGESWQDRIDLANSLKQLNVKYIPVNFLYPQRNTPFASMKPLLPKEALRVIAVFRHLIPDATLRICGGRPTSLGEEQDKIFYAGANALMTGNYLTTPGFSTKDDLEMLQKLGYEIMD